MKPDDDTGVYLIAGIVIGVLLASLFFSVEPHRLNAVQISRTACYMITARRPTV